jgi:hypothetical protein
MNIKHSAIFAIICVVMAIVAKYIFGFNFWIALGLSAGSLILNSLIAEWEDRRRDR